MKRKHTFVEGEYYHIYNRGVDKRDIFLDDFDYKRFLILLYGCNSGERLRNGYFDCKTKSMQDWFSGRLFASVVDIGAYCLMPNHFHLLLRAKDEVLISLFLRKVCTAYVMYFNAKYRRSGTLFQGRFKSKHADEDCYLKYLFSYIHLNPLELYDSDWKTKGLKDIDSAKRYLKVYPFSSLLDMKNGVARAQKALLDISAFPEYFMSEKDINQHIDDFLTSFKSRGPSSGLGN